MSVSFCVHKNLSFSCPICNPNTEEEKVVESKEDDQFTEKVRCKRCDSPTVSNPKRKTYGCPVCLYNSHKKTWPFDSNARIVHTSEWQVHTEMMKEIKKFRQNHWIKIPKERRSEILAGANLSEEYSKIHKELLNFLRN